MIRKLIFLPLILLFISCSVTKRVHRPGFHIQWHKIERTQSTKKQQPITDEAKTEKTNQEIALRFQKVNNIDSTKVEANKQVETASIISTKPKKNKRSPRLSSVIEKTAFQSIIKAPKNKAKAYSHKSSRPIFWRVSAKNLKSIGNVLIFLGTLILLGSILVYAGAFSGGASGSWANFFLDLIAISEWFWILVIILIVVLLLYLSVLLVRHVFGGTLVGLIIGLSLLVIGLFFRTLGKNREIEA